MTALVGPLPTVTFRGGPRVPPHQRGARPKAAYVPPRDTCDPRVDACTDHHVACDCREAEWAEWAREARYERQEMQATFDKVLAGHATHPEYRLVGSEWVTGAMCSCTGCQIARACHIYPASAES